MADTKISALTAITGANTAVGDLAVVVDISDTTMAASGTDKNMTIAELAQGVALDGRLIFNAASTPATPAASTMAIFGRKVANRMLPAFIGPSGLDSILQPSIARNKIGFVNANGNATTLGVLGLAMTATGTATAANVATTNIHTWSKRLDYLVTVAATTAVAGFRSTAAQYGTGNGAGLGGFFFVCRWAPSTGVATTTTRCFVGLQNSTSAPTDVNPSGILNTIGAGWDNGDTNIQIMHNDGSGAATKVDLGASFPRPSVDRSQMFELAMFCAPNTTTIYYEFTNIGTGAVATGNYTTKIPSTTTLLTPSGWMSVGGTSSVIGIALCSLYIETDQ